MTEQKMTVTDETYETYKHLLYKVVHTHQKSYGGEWDDLMSTANLWFLKAMQSYDETKSKASTWISFIVSKALVRETIREAIRLSREHPFSSHTKGVPLKMMMNPYLFFVELTDDAKTLTDRMLESPGRNLDQLFYQMKREGWTNKRIDKSFREVKDSLVN